MYVATLLLNHAGERVVVQKPFLVGTTWHDIICTSNHVWIFIAAQPQNGVCVCLVVGRLHSIYNGWCWVATAVLFSLVVVASH